MAFKMMGGKTLKEKTGAGIPLSMKSPMYQMKKQGYNDKEDESLGMRTGAEKGKSQSMSSRRDESYGDFGKRGMKQMDKKAPVKQTAKQSAKLPEALVKEIASKKGGPKQTKAELDAVKKDNTPKNQARVKARKDKEKVELGKKKAKFRLDQEEGIAKVKARKDKKKADLEKEKADFRKEQALGMARVKARKDKEKMELKKKKANFRKEQEEGMARVAARKAKKANN